MIDLFTDLSRRRREKKARVGDLSRKREGEMRTGIDDTYLSTS